MQPASDGIFDGLFVLLNSMDFSNGKGDNKAGPGKIKRSQVLLDSGTLETILPDDVANQLAQLAGAVFDKKEKGFVIPCSAASSSANVTFGLGETGAAKINVPLDQLILESLGSTFDSGPNKGEQKCFFAVLPSGKGPAILGDTTLRSAYVVFDMANNEAGVACTKFNVNTSNIVPFPSMSATIPSSTPEPGLTGAKKAAQASNTSEIVRRYVPRGHYVGRSH
jgi:elongation factor G